MKPSTEYFSEARPFTDTDDASLLDALEQMLAVTAEAELYGLCWQVEPHRQPDGSVVVRVTRPGDDVFEGPTLRAALRECFNSE